MQFENISIHCENGHIVESCEITATVAPSVIFCEKSAAGIRRFCDLPTTENDVLSV